MRVSNRWHNFHLINLIPPNIKSWTVLWTVACSYSASPHYLSWMTCAECTRTRPPFAVRTHARWAACHFLDSLTGPDQGARREQPEWIRVDCPESANSSPSTKWTPERQHPREHFLKKRSIGSGNLNEARVMPFSDSRERTEPATWARPSLSSNLTDHEHFCEFTRVKTVSTAV